MDNFMKEDESTDGAIGEADVLREALAGFNEKALADSLLRSVVDAIGFSRGKELYAPVPPPDDESPEVRMYREYYESCVARVLALVHEMARAYPNRNG